MKEFSIIEQLNESQIKQLHHLLQQMWWSRERSLDEVLTMLKTSMSFGLIENETQDLVGYARVLTDEIKYAFIFDVMVVEKYRGNGFGKRIVDAVIGHPRLKNIKRFELTCAEDMVPFYEKFSFSKDYGEAIPMRLKK